MFNVLFWNLHKNSIEDYLTACIEEKQIDIAVLAEFGGINFEKLKEKLCGFYSLYPGLKADETKVVLIGRNNIKINVIQELSRYVIYKIETLLKTYIIVGLHLEDRRNYNSDDRINTIKSILSDLEQIEQLFQCKNTIVIGDFNANLFDKEIVSYHGFNAVLFKAVIEESEVRTWQSNGKQRFYSPMIHYISEDTQMYGSYYYTSGANTIYWYCLDQVLFRKPLINNINNIQYIKKIRETDLIARSQPKSCISDHLPLFVSIMGED